MILTFKNRDLRRFWKKGDVRGINPQSVNRLRRLQDVLDAADKIIDVPIYGTGLHALTSDRQGQWAMTVTRNWRLTFRFENGNAYEVNFEDYHGK